VLVPEEPSELQRRVVRCDLSAMSIVAGQAARPDGEQLTRHQSIHVFLHPIFKLIRPRSGGFYAEFALGYRMSWRLALSRRFAYCRLEFEGESWGRRV
jgi:hypothetical protein